MNFLWNQPKRGRTLKYSSPGKITSEELIMCRVYVFQIVIYGSIGISETYEELEVQLNHFNILRKYNLI